MPISFMQPIVDADGIVIGEAANTLYSVADDADLREEFLKLFNPNGEYFQFRVQWLNNSARRAVVLGIREAYSVFSQTDTASVPLAVLPGMKASLLTKSLTVMDALNVITSEWGYKFEKYVNQVDPGQQTPVHNYSATTALGKVTVSSMDQRDALKGIAGAIVDQIDNYLSRTEGEVELDKFWLQPGTVAAYFDLGGKRLYEFARLLSAVKYS